MKITNIAILVHGLHTGGAERIAGLLSKELSKIYNVYLFLISTENKVYDYGGTIVDLGVFEDYERGIKMYKRKYHIDCAISFLEAMNFWNIRTRETEKVIVSRRIAGSLESTVNLMERVMIQKYYHYADAVVACSEGVKFDLIYNYQVPKDAVRTIYNFIDKEGIVSKAQEKLSKEVQDFLKGAEFFLNVGRLHPQKNQRRLLLQFSYFHKRNPQIKMLILGSGDLHSELISCIEELELSDSVKIIPYTKNPFAYMSKAKALILSSHYEGLPNVLLEAMSLGCPIIATDCLAGPRELLMDKFDYKRNLSALEICERGVVVCDEKTENDGTTQYMAKAMEMICTSEIMARNFRKNGLKYMEEYTNQNILKQWIEVINEVGRNETISVRKKEEEEIESAKHLVIYGAGIGGKEMFHQLDGRYEISCFVVSKRKEGEEECLGLPIREITELEYSPKDTAIIIGVGAQYQNEVISTLWEYGYTKIVFPYMDF